MDAFQDAVEASAILIHHENQGIVAFNGLDLLERIDKGIAGLIAPGLADGLKIEGDLLLGDAEVFGDLFLGDAFGCEFSDGGGVGFALFGGSDHGCLRGQGCGELRCDHGSIEHMFFYVKSDFRGPAADLAGVPALHLRDSEIGRAHV